MSIEYAVAPLHALAVCIQWKKQQCVTDASVPAGCGRAQRSAVAHPAPIPHPSPLEGNRVRKLDLLPCGATCPRTHGCPHEYCKKRRKVRAHYLFYRIDGKLVAIYGRAGGRYQHQRIALEKWKRRGQKLKFTHGEMGIKHFPLLSPNPIFPPSDAVRWRHGYLACLGPFQKFQSFSGTCVTVRESPRQKIST